MWTLCGHCELFGTCCIWVELPVQRRLCPIFHEWCLVIRHPRLFCRLTGCQRTPRFWGVTHIEKNVCENIIGTLLNIAGKTKDELNSRLDLVEMCLRSELAPRFESKRTYLPPVCYTLSTMEKNVFCQTLS